MQNLPLLLAPILEDLPRASTGPDLTRYFMACGLILLLIVGLAFGFRRLFAGSLRRRAARRSLRIVDVLPLGGKQRLSVVRCYDRTFALGIGEKEVTLVAELDGVIGDERHEGQPEVEDNDFARLLESAKERIQAATGGGARRARSESAGASGESRVEELVG